jgi:two-component system, OmpR family, heavy metal sensor histidine kinase CusS
MFLRNIYNNWSIKVRLTVLIILVSTVTSYVMFEITLLTLHTSLSREENDFVNDRLHMFHAIIKNKPDYLEIIKQDIKWESDNMSFPYYYLRCIDESNRVLIETPGMEKTIPVQWVHKLLPTVHAFGQKDVIRQAYNGRYFLLMADSVVPPYGEAKKMTVQIALDVTSEEIIENENRKKLVAMVVGWAFIFSGIIILIVRKILNPLDEIVRISELVSVSKISERTNPEGWPKEVKRLALSFNSMLNRLENAFARLSQVTSNMAHEIRTPINNFMGEAEIALSKDRTPEEYRKVLASGIEECERLSRLINSLLFLARAENPTDSITRENFDPLKEIEDALSFYEPQIESKGAEIACCGNGLINGDILLFRQAISNLLKNALNYSSIGVKINMSIQETEDRHLEVIVSDTGYGMEEKDLARIFDRFYRVDRVRSNNPEGSGLGLSIVRAIMDLHGGSISIASRLGKGTTVTLLFPSGDLPSGHRS